MLSMDVHYPSVGNKRVEPWPLVPYRPEEGDLGIVVLHMTLNE